MLVEQQIVDWHKPVAARRVTGLMQQGAEALEEKTAAEAAGTRLAIMTKYIRLADQWYRSGGAQGAERDAYELPGFVLEALSELPEEITLLIGSWVAGPLGIRTGTREVGQLWIQDTKNTAWRLLIEQGQWSGGCPDDREPVEPE